MQIWPVHTGLQYIYISTCVPCLLLRFDIKLGFAPQPVLLLLSAREVIVNQTHTPSYLCLVILLTKFKGSLVSDSYLPTFSPSSARAPGVYIVAILSWRLTCTRPGWRTLTLWPSMTFYSPSTGFHGILWPDWKVELYFPKWPYFPTVTCLSSAGGI